MYAALHRHVRFRMQSLCDHLEIVRLRSNHEEYSRVWPKYGPEQQVLPFIPFFPSEYAFSVFHLSSIFMQGYQEKAYLEMGVSFNMLSEMWRIHCRMFPQWPSTTQMPILKADRSHCGLCPLNHVCSPPKNHNLFVFSAYYHTAEVYEPQRLERNLSNERLCELDLDCFHLQKSPLTRSQFSPRVPSQSMRSTRMMWISPDRSQ